MERSISGRAGHGRIQVILRRMALGSLVLALAVVAGCDRTTAPDVMEDCTDVRQLAEDASIPASAVRAVLEDPPGYITPDDPRFPSGRLVVIRIAARDAPANPSLDVAWVRRVFFQDVEKSVAALFRENSYGRFLVSEGAIPPWVTIPDSVGGIGGIEASDPFIRSVLSRASVDWAALDADGNGAISQAEAQIVLLPVFGSWASMRPVSPGVVATPTGTFDFAPRPIVYRTVPATGPAGPDPVYAHELGHAFFLPGLDRRDATVARGWEMMSHGREWTHFHVYDKMVLGWLEPTFLARDLAECVRFPPIELQAAALVLFAPPVMTGGEIDPSEYWIVEYRNKQYSSAAVEDDLPEDGLLVWYVRQGTWTIGFDEIRLVDEQQPGASPVTYTPGPDAAFSSYPGSYRLYNGGGGWSGLQFSDVTGLDALIGAVF